MEDKKSFWRSKVEFITRGPLEELQEAINEFCQDKFVVGIQYPDGFQSRISRVAVVSYKVQE